MRLRGQRSPLPAPPELQLPYDAMELSFAWAEAAKPRPRLKLASILIPGSPANACGLERSCGATTQAEITVRIPRCADGWACVPSLRYLCGNGTKRSAYWKRFPPSP